MLAQVEAVPVSGVAEFKELEEVEGLEEQGPIIGRSVVVPLHDLISLHAPVLLSQKQSMLDFSMQQILLLLLQILLLLLNKLYELKLQYWTNDVLTVVLYPSIQILRINELVTC